MAHSPPAPLSSQGYTQITIENNTNRRDVLANILNHEKTRCSSLDAQLDNCQGLAREMRLLLQSVGLHTSAKKKQLQQQLFRDPKVDDGNGNSINSTSSSDEDVIIQRKIAALNRQCFAKKQECISKELELRESKRAIEIFRTRRAMCISMKDKIDHVLRSLHEHNRLVQVRVELLQGLLGCVGVAREGAIKQSEGVKENRRELTNALCAARTQLQQWTSACTTTRARLIENEMLAAQLLIDVDALKGKIGDAGMTEGTTSPEEQSIAGMEAQLIDLQQQLQALQRRKSQASETNKVQRKGDDGDQRAVGLGGGAASGFTLQLSEAMALLKSTVINFSTDLKRIHAARRMSESDLESRFKEAVNEVKIALAPVLAGEAKGAFSKRIDAWPINGEMIEAHFPKHKIETVHWALHDMVVAWDALSMAAKQRLTTARDVQGNADVLHLLASYVGRKRALKWVPLRSGNNLTRQASEMFRLPSRGPQFGNAAAAASQDRSPSPLRPAASSAELAKKRRTVSFERSESDKRH